MHNATTYRTTIVLLLTGLSISAWSQDAHELRQRAAKTNTEQVNRAYTNNLPNGGGSSSSMSYDAQKVRELAEKQQAEARVAAIEAQQYEELKRDLRDREIAYADARQKLYADTKDKLWPALKDLAMNYSDTHMDDRLDWYGDMFFACMEWGNLRTDYLNYPAARAANFKFTAEKETATYEQLSEMIYNARLLPNTALAHLEELRLRFPEKLAESEVLELKIIPYYFGANRPYLHQRSHYEKDFYYPKSLFEQKDIPEATRMAQLERFIALTEKHPEAGLAAAGYFRPHLNPFGLYVKAHPELSKEKIEEYYWMSLHMKVPQPGKDYTVEILNVETGHANAYRLSETITWLITNSDERLKTITEAEWVEIADNRLGIGLKVLNGIFIYVKKKNKKETELVKLYKLYKNFSAACKAKGIKPDAY